MSNIQPKKPISALTHEDVRQALRAHVGDTLGAAEALGISRASLYILQRRFGLRVRGYLGRKVERDVLNEVIK